MLCRQYQVIISNRRREHRSGRDFTDGQYVPGKLQRQSGCSWFMPLPNELSQGPTQRALMDAPYLLSHNTQHLPLATG